MLDLAPYIQIQHCYNLLSEVSLELLLLAHIPTGMVAILFSFFVVYKNRTQASYALLFVSLFFLLWSFLNLNTWFAFLGATNTMFTWSLIDLISLFFFIFTYRFLYTFINNHGMPLWQILVGFGLILPTAITTLTGINITDFDANTCEAIESSWIVLYPYFVQGVTLIAIIVLGVSSFKKETDRSKKEQVILAATGVFLFLFFFFSATFIVTLLINYTSVASPYNYAIYGLFGMPVLLMFLGYLIVKYKAFNIKLIGAEALITTLVLLDASQVFFSSSRTEFVANLITILLIILFGSFLIRSVKKEIAAKERNEQLAKDLAHANARLRELDRQKSEFVSIASHQLRSPLAAIRGYASMMLEGSYGKLPEKVRGIVERIQESSAFMALSIEDFLDVSRIEQGRMKYEFSEVNLHSVAEKVVDELRSSALKRGLVLMFKSDCKGNCMVKADHGKIRQIIYNLIDNAIKYTKKGSINVLAHDDVEQHTFFITIQDTGIGMSEETRKAIFEKFVRAKNANSVNVQGTGLGLYVAKQMIEAMGGKITPRSEGEGKGSSFTIELPLI